MGFRLAEAVLDAGVVAMTSASVAEAFHTPVGQLALDEEGERAESADR